MSDNKKDSLRLGFLTAIEVPDSGYVGGLLVTNRFGRPLEFQCTTPVKPTRTQSILYGPTLVPYILGELIGRTLVEKLGIAPHLLVTDYPEMLELRSHTSIPVACLDAETIVVKAAASEFDGNETQIMDLTQVKARDEQPRETPSPGGISVGRHFLRFHPEHVSDCRIVEEQGQRIPTDADLREPLDRVREALTETAQSGAVR